MTQHNRLVRHRSPRVHMEYEVTVNGVVRKIELPFVTGVLADLSGKPTELLEPVNDRMFVEIDKHNFDSVMTAMRPRVAFQVPCTLTGEGNLLVDITFAGMAAFSPSAVIEQVEPLNRLLELRQQPTDIRHAMTGGDYTPPSDASVIAEIDRRIGEQLDFILHHEDFQKLESAWRGLHYLVNHTETDEMLKIRVLNISKRELRETLKKFKGTAWDQSPIFRKVYRDEYNKVGGSPFGCLVGDFYFDHSPDDVELLSEMANVCAAAHAPFLTAVSPFLMNMESWRELPIPRDLAKIFWTPEYAAWRSLRDSENARYLALTLPRFLVRHPYGPNSLPVAEFAYDEDIGDFDHRKLLWANSAYLMALNVCRSYKIHGWCSKIAGLESGGAIEGLPKVEPAVADGSRRRLCPIEVEIDNRRETELSKIGLIALVHRNDLDIAVFHTVNSLWKPVEYDDPDATDNARLSAPLSYVFAACRVAHYVKAIMLNKGALNSESSDSLQRWLNDWLAKYVDATPDMPNAFVQSPRPFAAAEVIVEEIEGNPGYYTTKFLLRPNE